MAIGLRLATQLARACPYFIKQHRLRVEREIEGTGFKEESRLWLTGEVLRLCIIEDAPFIDCELAPLDLDEWWVINDVWMLFGTERAWPLGTFGENEPHDQLVRLCAALRSRWTDLERSFSPGEYPSVRGRLKEIVNERMRQARRMLTFREEGE